MTDQETCRACGAASDEPCGYGPGVTGDPMTSCGPVPAKTYYAPSPYRGGWPMAMMLPGPLSREQRRRMFDPAANARAAAAYMRQRYPTQRWEAFRDGTKLGDVVAVEFEFKTFVPEDVAAGRAGVVPRALYGLGRRWDSPRVRRLARRLDRRLKAVYARRDAQLAAYQRLTGASR